MRYVDFGGNIAKEVMYGYLFEQYILIESYFDDLRLSCILWPVTLLQLAHQM